MNTTFSLSFDIIAGNLLVMVTVLARVVRRPPLLSQFCPSVRLSLCHTGDPRLNGSVYRNLLWNALHNRMMLLQFSEVKLRSPQFMGLHRTKKLQRK